MRNNKDFRIYFEKCKKIRIQRDITDANVWNIDKIKFHIGCGITY